MGLFRGRQEKENVAELMREFKNSQNIAKDGKARFESETGLDVKSVLKQGKAMSRSGAMDDMAAYAARAARLAQAGVDTPATLVSFQLGEHAPMLGGIPADFQVTVQPPSGAPYEVTSNQVLHESMATTLVAGMPVTVRVDPDDPQSLLIWGTSAPAPAPEPPPAAPTEERIGRLVKLQELRSAGVLSEDEFEVQKAKLLGE
jgi:hypothetical protein